jgi:hypothetical protein
MTKISQYPTLSNPTEDDILIGTDVNNSDETKNFSIGSIVNLVENASMPYKSYVVFFSQSGTNNPVITELYNTIGTITWNRSSTGNYTATAASGTFPSNKTFFPNKQFCRYSESGIVRNVYMSIAGVSNDLIGLSQSNESGIAVDGLNFNLEIRVYN